MMDLAVVLADGVRVLDDSRHARDDAQRLEAESRELVLTHRSHRIHPITGASSDTACRDAKISGHAYGFS